MQTHVEMIMLAYISNDVCRPIVSTRRDATLTPTFSVLSLHDPSAVAGCRVNNASSILFPVSSSNSPRLVLVDSPAGRYVIW